MAANVKKRNSFQILTKSLARAGSLTTELRRGSDVDSAYTNGEYRRESDEYMNSMPGEESNVADAIDISQDSLDDFLKLNKLNPGELQFTWSVVLSL